MRHYRRPIRALIVALLAATTSMVAVCAPVSAQAMASKMGRSKSPVKTCCCGTADGKCCGMGCCLRRTPNQLPTNPPMRTGMEKERSQVLALVVQACDGESTGGGYSGAAHSEIYGLLAVPTLQSQHVRIQT